MRLGLLTTIFSLIRPALGGAVGGAMVRHALMPLVWLLVLAVVAGMLASILLAIILLMIDHYLILQGFAPLEAMTATAIFTLLLLLCALAAMHRVTMHTRGVLRPTALGDVSHAFMKGFNRRTK